ncbi:hypothetical protein TrST_g6014 [Triparma strigata]|uniref:EF-hand domain-containing protein n=1 Tax=Triparma strigata TaxID=1606541 RepID=A0A9W7EAY8_9STRA|nr:hypothetical protein TrST_g6014 [Triparma strigata]
MSAHVPNHTHSNFTPQRGLKVVDFVCRKMQQQMKHDVSLGGSWFKLFQKYDADSSGMLDFGELVHVLRKEVKIRKTEVSDNELHLLWATFDSDGSGFVTIKEFSGFMRRYQHFGKASFLGKIPITPMANVKELSNAIMEAGKAMMKEDNKLVLDEVTTQFQGTEYQEFAGWLHANADRYDEDGNGRIEIHELETAIHEFQLEMDRDKARLAAGGPETTLKTAASMPNLGAFNTTRPINPYNFMTMNEKMKSIREYRTIAGYSSVERAGPIMGRIPHRASDWAPVAEKLRIDLDLKKTTRDRYEDTTFTGAPSTSLTKLPLASYKAGAHMHNYVNTRWGGWRSRNDKVMLIKNTILPPEEKQFLEQVRESHKPPMWPKPMEEDLHWSQRLSTIPTMSKLMQSQSRYEDLVGKMKHI